MRHTARMTTILDALRRAVRRGRQAATTEQHRAVDEERDREAAQAWQRPGGPVDAGFTS